jgi:hypothetical protein
MNQEFKVQFAKPLSNFGGIGLMVCNDLEHVRVQWYDKEPSRPLKLYYNEKRDSYYFNYAGRRWYTDEFLAVNRW